MKIVILDGYTLNPGDLTWYGFKALGNIELYERTPYDKVVERCQGAGIILTNKTPIDESIITQLPSLQYIGVLATGHNIVDTGFARKKGIVVTNVPGYGTASVAQMTFALLLELCHHVQRHSDSVMAGDWSKNPDWCYWNFPLVELAGKTMGIIGYGNIGRKVGEIAGVFGMKIIAASGNRSSQAVPDIHFTSIESLLESSDVISIHCPLSTETKGLINKKNLQKMKRSAFLLNTSRGPIVIDQDLAEALNNEIIAGAGLDVLSMEPPERSNPLFNAKNCIITPHISWATREARTRLMQTALQNLHSFIGGTPMNIVN